MKYKKYSYIIVLILMLLVGMNKTYAAQEKTCNYLSENNEAAAKLTIKWGYGVSWIHSGRAYSEASFQKLGEKIDNDTETIQNWYSDVNPPYKSTIVAINNGRGEANKNSTCPEYLIMVTNNKYSNYVAYAAKTKIEAQKIVNEFTEAGSHKAWYLSYKNEEGIAITDEEYYQGAFGYIKGDSMVDFDAEITCTDLFGDENKEDSLAYMINIVFEYVRIIVPILVIVLGLLDFAKAVIAGKEDEMKKAQTTFIKRVIIGVAVFFVPLLVNIIMDLADIVWEGLGYTVCEFK